MPDSALSGRLWPVHLKPLPDELLSSWIIRLAAAHGLKLHTFCTLAFGTRSIWNRDIDNLAPPEVLSVLVERTATPPERVRRTTLRVYEGRLFEALNPNGNSRWILPVGIYHRMRRHPGLQFCPRCLAEDQEPYFRTHWRLACTTLCVRHEVVLLERCPDCGTAVNFHRGDLGDRNKRVPDPITVCHACRLDLACASEAQEAAEVGECMQQHQLARQLREGWAWVPRRGWVYSHLYFTGLRQLVRLLAVGTTRHRVHGTKAQRFHDAVCRRYGVEPFAATFAPGVKNMERLGVADRRRLLGLAHLLLSDWPAGFVEVCQAEGVWSSTLLRDLDPAPFWYWRVVHDALERSTYHASLEEIAWAVAKNAEVFGGRYRPPGGRVRVEWIGER